MKDIINGINTIISNKTPSIKSKRLDISNPKFAFSTIFPKRIKIGNNKGIVISAPSADPLFKLNEFPKANKLIKMYVEINNDGSAIFKEEISSDIFIEKNVPKHDIGMPIKIQ
tara:strand:+ start:635 stop:973 length:339 start_codon:yes stop_codon:yes gene_type:complete